MDSDDLEMLAALGGDSIRVLATCVALEWLRPRCFGRMRFAKHVGKDVLCRSFYWNQLMQMENSRIASVSRSKHTDILNGVALARNHLQDFTR